MTEGENPFGDGTAAVQIADILTERFRIGRLFAAQMVDPSVPQH
jgi:UDP-N-acetylglucosamine 2-epimerase